MKAALRLFIEFVISIIIYRLCLHFLNKFLYALYVKQIFKAMLHALVVAYFIYFISKCFYKLVMQSEAMRPLMKNIYTSLYFIISLLLFLELVFTFVARSHGSDFTLAARNWFSYYWKINGRGYRDADFSRKDSSKKKIAFIGDSFTAGHGIEHPGDRFPDLVGKAFAGKYEFYNLGICGLNSNDEYKQLIEFPYKPNIVVLQYCGNDMEDLDTTARGKFNYTPYGTFGAIKYQFITGSYLANYIFWLYPHGNFSGYAHYMDSLYNNAALFTKHLATLNKFVEYCRRNNTMFIVVVIPTLAVDMKQSEVFTKPIASFFRKNNVPVINVADFAGNFPISDRIVNANDGHASIKLNKIIADSLINIINRAQ